MPSISYEQINPLLLPKDHKFTELIVKNAHIDAGHMGLNCTIHALRKKCWVPKQHSLIRQVIIN